MKMGTQQPQIYVTKQKQSKEGILQHQAYLKKQEKFQIKNLTLHLKELKKTMNKAKVSGRKQK